MKILFVTSVSHQPSQKNLIHFQRVYFLSRVTELTILARHDADFSASAGDRAAIVRSPFSGNLGLLVTGIFMALIGRARRYDLVLTEPSMLGLVGFAFKLLGCRHWVVDLWDVPGRTDGRGGLRERKRSPIAVFLLRRAYRRADRFIVSILPEFELREFDLPRDKMLVMTYGIWLDEKRGELAPVADSKTILCTASIYRPEMGLDVLLAAFAALNAENDGMRLVVIGQVPAYMIVERERLRHTPNITHINGLEHEDLQERITAATVCVVPFHDVVELAQIYPIRVLEYMALGKAIIGSAVGGVARMIWHGENGLLFEPGKSSDLAEAIRVLCTDYTLRDRISAGALRGVDDYDCVKKNAEIIYNFELIVAGK